jgi:hypothetical protein
MARLASNSANIFFAEFSTSSCGVKLLALAGGAGASAAHAPAANKLKSNALMILVTWFSPLLSDPLTQSSDHPLWIW